MGQLDDAIREHLELKRLRGADPEEVSRQEHEALGPVRRERGTAEEIEQDHDEPESDEALAVEPETPLVDEDVPRGPGGTVPAAAVPEAGQPTEEWGFEEDEEVEDPDGDPSDEDVLEETPEFLQETPEHERLWFEQKPPRDFDFDS